MPFSLAATRGEPFPSVTREKSPKPPGTWKASGEGIGSLDSAGKFGIAFKAGKHIHPVN